jgi:endogenous inhibitor of DNA gyrase (YacG/DUF329 family)
MIRCPICKKPVEKENPEFPFCSERCRLIDLGNWASEKYRVPGPPANDPNKSEDQE